MAGYKNAEEPTTRRSWMQSERGAALIEYAVIMAAVLSIGTFAVDKLGDKFVEEYGAAAEAVGGDEIGTCPNGWNLIVDGQTKKNGQNVDANGDGYICRKDIPGGGNGNTNNNQNVKDNNGPAGEPAGEVLVLEPALSEAEEDEKSRGEGKEKDRDKDRFVNPYE